MSSPPLRDPKDTTDAPRSWGPSPVSSPYRDASSPFKFSQKSSINPVSSPLMDPISSPYQDAPASSPLYIPTSPRVLLLSSSDDDEIYPARKRYKFHDDQPENASSDLYWPVAGPTQDTLNEPTEMMECVQSFWNFHAEPTVPDNPSFSASSSSSDLSSDVSSSYSDHLSSSSSSPLCSDSSSSSESTSVPYDDSDHDDDSDSEGENDVGPDQAKKLFERSDLSVDEGVLLLMNSYKKRKLKKSLIGDILEVVLQFLPKNNNMPKSQYHLFKYVKDLCPLSPQKTHFYCKNCLFYLGEKFSNCSLCKSELCNKFIQLSLADQIKNLFELHGLADLIDTFNSDRMEKIVEGTYTDICDGSEFKRAWCGGKYDLVLHGYTDGVSLSKSSDVYFWPLEFIICQIPPHVRFRFVLTLGIWVDSSKPLMNSYLLPFVKELKELYESGVKWTHPQSKTEFTSRVSAPGFCGDAPVRSQIQNVMQHGGRYCCNMCEQKMVSCKCKETGQKKRVFHLKEKDSRLRTAEKMEVQGGRTKELKGRNKLKTCKGVKGRSVISKLPTCNRGTVVYPEYMHLMLGIVKQFLRLWFETNRKDEWSLKAHEDDISTLLKGIRVPDFLRVSRSLDCFSKWKASECRSFLLFYSSVVLSDFMTEKYFQHWVLLVIAIYILLQDSITECDIVKAELLLKMFLRDFATLYRADDFTYNLHNLIHLGLTVRRYGPLWANSAFNFESLNGDLTDCIHGTKNHAVELTNTLNFFQGTQALKARVEATNVCPDTLIGKKVVEFRSKMKKKKY